MEQEQVAKEHAELPKTVLRERYAAAMNGNADDVVETCSERGRERCDG
jgi:Leu/Phe-tRNA-protein transferase